MKHITEWGGQNWVITPAALAINETPPQNIIFQKWHLLLSGVAIAKVKSTKPNDWTEEMLHIKPDIDGPLQYVINHFSVPIPSDTPYIYNCVEFPRRIVPLFQVEEMAPYAALGSIFDNHTAVNAGFAVNTWRPSPFLTLHDSRVGGNAPTINNIFEGIVVDVAVQDIDAILYRISYHITLLGKIVFALCDPH